MGGDSGVLKADPHCRMVKPAQYCKALSSNQNKKELKQTKNCSESVRLLVKNQGHV